MSNSKPRQVLQREGARPLQIRARGPGPGVESCESFLEKAGPEACRSQREGVVDWRKGGTLVAQGTVCAKALQWDRAKSFWE